MFRPQPLLAAQAAVAGLVIAAGVFRARAMIHNTVACHECSGSGAERPGCSVCHGYRSIRLKAAYARGYCKAELRDVDESDGYCECPECEGDVCHFCSGDGSIPVHEQAQQERRVLIYARYQQIPPLRTMDYYGRPRSEDQLLSAKAAGDLIEAGHGIRLNSVFGHEFYLTDQGKAQFAELWREARNRAAQLHRDHPLRK